MPRLNYNSYLWIKMKLGHMVGSAIADATHDLEVVSSGLTLGVDIA